MKKNYKFNEERGCYEFCAKKDCDMQDQLRDGDMPHKICAECIEDFEGVAPDNSELSSTSKIRKARKEIPSADKFISGVGTNSSVLANDQSHKHSKVRRPDLDEMEAGDI